MGNTHVGEEGLYNPECNCPDCAFMGGPEHGARRAGELDFIKHIKQARERERGQNEGGCFNAYSG